MTEICCENCKHGPCGLCRENYWCLDSTGKYDKPRGKHDKFYNHFVPKEDKVTMADPNWDKKNKVDYKATGKALTARQVIAESKINYNEMCRFLQWFKNNGTSNIDYNLFNENAFSLYALQHTCFHGFLLAGGYIEKVDTWEPVKVGDRFKNGENTFIIASTKGNCALINVENGHQYGGADTVKVKNKAAITRAEFDAMVGDNMAKFFKRIDELERI